MQRVAAKEGKTRQKGEEGEKERNGYEVHFYTDSKGGRIRRKKCQTNKTRKV